MTAIDTYNPAAAPSSVGLDEYCVSAVEREDIFKILGAHVRHKPPRKALNANTVGSSPHFSLPRSFQTPTRATSIR
jgi:hypothetical protein